MAQPSEASQSSGSVQVIDAKTAREMMNDGEAYILVDVRTEDEFNQGHIEGALLLPYDRINTLASTLIPDTSSRILLYCRSGRRSALAAEALIDMGYTNVYDFGGINDWPYEVVS
ncbi:MAG: rhodanese-like domain-containing protein [Clostridiaceae bacterium]|nr:rhodanese-like domain-containing protein [Clostridiaceae bacterium]